MAKISLRSVSSANVRHQEGGVIRDLSLEIEDREFVALVGPPRCGITSVIRLIAGLDRSFSGDIAIGDRSVREIPPKDRDVALVPGNFMTYPNLSMRDGLGLPLSIRKRPKAEIHKRVLAASELVKLPQLSDRRPNSLSDEQRQRVAMAHAIALNPKAILFDEPYLGLDDNSRRTLRNEILKLHQRLQITMVYGTHNPIEAMAMSGRIVVLNAGVIEQEGPALAVYENPASTFVAQFIGSMSLVHGALKRERDWWIFAEQEPGAMKIRLPLSQLSQDGEFIGGNAVLGLHPEDVELISNVTGKENDVFPAIVDLAEPVGGEANLYLQTGAHTIISRTRDRTRGIGAGRRSHFRVNADKACLFDPVSGKRIS
jgi:multiple sugar transport system ATP-binding protein